MNNEIINEIRTKTDIVEIISNYIPLTKRGKNYFCVCPFHDDHSPSMSVSPEKQIYTCFSCGASGNVFTFVSEYEHISFPEAVKLLGNKLGIEIDSKSKRVDVNNKYYEIYELALKFYQNNLYSALGKNAISYLKKRKFDEQTIKKFGIGLSIKTSSLTNYLIQKGYTIDDLIKIGLTNDGVNDFFVNRIMFPLYDLNGRVVAFSGRIYNTTDTSKYQNTKETIIFKKGNILYNYHMAHEQLKKNDTIIVMEGFMDVIRASTVGINNTIATMGTAVTKNQALLIKKMSHNVILCFDGDEAGSEATLSVVSMLEDMDINVKIVRLEDNLDPDEYIVKHGVNSFKNKIDKPINLIDFKMNILKQSKNLTDLKEIASYVDDALKELIKENDEIVLELNLKKLAGEFGIEYDTLKNKYLRIKKNSSKKIEVDIIPKKNVKLTKYNIAERNLIIYMLKDEKVIYMFENNVTYIPTANLRYLANEIIYYYHKYGNINIADFITYIEDKEELSNTLKELLMYDIKDTFSEEEIDNYLYTIREFNVLNKIKKLESELKKEDDPLKQAEILDSIRDIKKENIMVKE